MTKRDHGKGSGGGCHQEQARVGKLRTKCPRCRGNVGHTCSVCDGKGWLPAETK